MSDSEQFEFFGSYYDPEHDDDGNTMSDSGCAKKLVDSLLVDLRSLSNEAKKRFPHVREASESAVVKLRNIADGRSGDAVIERMRHVANEILHPFLMGCASKQSRLVQISLTAIQRLVAHKALDLNSSTIVVNELWALMECECEELRVLQTLALLVSTEKLVSGQILARCLVMCFRLHFAKDPTVINTASASVRQLVGQVFDRVLVEDDTSPPKTPPSEQMKSHSKVAPRTLLPAAADAYMLFQDICLLVNAEQPLWLVGITEMTRTLGLELLENALTEYANIFANHAEFVFLLKEQVCPLVIKLFSPNLKFVQVASQHPYSRPDITGSPQMAGDRPYFPIAMRLLRVVSILITNYNEMLVTECEIFLSLIMKFLDSDKLPWQRGLALEVLHRIMAKPDLLRSFCSNYDIKPHSAKVLQSLVSGLAGLVHSTFDQLQTRVSASNIVSSNDYEGQHDVRSQNTGQPGFVYRGAWIPLYSISHQGAPKSILLEVLDKHEPPSLPDGYCLSLAYTSLLDTTNSLHQAIEKSGPQSELSQQLFFSTQCGVLAALSLLLEASIDENVTESLLKSLSLMVSLACKLSQNGVRDACLGAMCKISLPANYMVRVLQISSSHSPGPIAADPLKSGHKAQDTLESHFDPSSHPSQVVAVGTACPTPNLSASLIGQSIMLTAKNLQSMRMLISTSQLNGPNFQDAWHTVLATLQHLVWILGMKPAPGGGFRSSESADSGTVITTAVMADVPVISSMLNKLFEMTSNLDDVGLHHVIAALCKLSTEAMQVAQTQREPSYFPVAKLMQTGLANLHRLSVFWKPVSAHLIEISSHSFLNLRKWGATALTALVKNALSTKETDQTDESKRQLMVVGPLLDMSEVGHEDVRQQQIDCLIQLLQSKGQTMDAELWPTVIRIVGNIVSGRFKFGEALIKHSYQAVNLLVTDFIQYLSLPCVQMLVDADAKFGTQQSELNISLSAVGQLWTISDYLYRNCPKPTTAELENLWLVLYTCLSELCVDSRPPIRKSACQTLLQTVTSHGAILKPETCRTMVWRVLFPMLDKVKSLTDSASTTTIDPASMGGSNILIHHSRDTENKQWSETSVQTLAAVVKILNSQRSSLLTLGDFHEIWSAVLGYIENSTTAENSEISVSALKSFYELLYGRQSIKDGGPAARKDRSHSSTDMGYSNIEPLAQIDSSLWLMAWQTWLRISLSLTNYRTGMSNKLVDKPICGQVVTDEPGGQTNFNEKLFIPGPNHLTVLLQIFPTLFDNCRPVLDPDDMPPLMSALKGVTTIPIGSDQAPFILPTEADVTPTQDAIIVCINAVYKEMMDSNSKLRCKLSNLFKLILAFVGYTCQAPTSHLLQAKSNSNADWVVQNYIPFGELCLRLVVDFFSSTAHFKEVIEGAVLTEIIKTTSIPMSLKYSCPSQTTWKLAASSVITVLRLGLPIARQHSKHFRGLWPEINQALEEFVFPTSSPPQPLNSEERKRHEFMDCQMIELVRAEVLPYVNSLPSDFVTRIIAMLNKGSISSADPNDVIGMDSYKQRSDFARACFDALLAMSQNEPDLVRCASPQSSQQMADGSRLGTGAINSLLLRCKQVVTNYVTDERMNGVMPLPQQRTAEMRNVLEAVVAMIDGLEKRETQGGDLWQELIDLYPCLVDCIICRDARVQESVIVTLKAYHVLLKPPTYT